MKKLLLAVILMFLITGCDNNMDSPTKKVETYFNQYQTLDKSVLDDLDRVLANDTSIDANAKKDYRDFMKSHYQDLDYTIINETINKDKATVTVDVTVKNYAKKLSDISIYKNNNPNEFNNENEEYDIGLFSAYRLKELKKVTDTMTYRLDITLTKINGVWQIDELSDADLNKINGLYAR